MPWPRPLVTAALIASLSAAAAIQAQAAGSESGGSSIPPTASRPATTSAPFLLGVATQGMPAKTAPLDRWTAATGNRPAVTGTFTSFVYDINGSALEALRERTGALPLVTWEPWNPHSPGTDSFPLKRIAAGDYDGYLQRNARTLAGLTGPVVLRFAHEMNGNWVPWGSGVGASTGADYVAAWRHVHDIVQASGADVIWLWAPSAWDRAAQPDYATLYPGDAYVDWTGLSAYLDHPNSTWARRIQPSIDRLDAVAPTKPIFFAETGVRPGPDRPAMLADLLAGAQATPRAVGLVYFDIVGRQDWRLDREPASAGVFARVRP